MNKIRWLEVGTVGLPALATLGLGELEAPGKHPWYVIGLVLVFLAGLWCVAARHKLQDAEKKGEEAAQARLAEDERAGRERLEGEYQARLSTQTTLIDEVSASIGELLDVLARLACESPASRAHQLLPTQQQIVVELLKVLRVHHERGRATLYVRTRMGDCRRRPVEAVTIGRATSSLTHRAARPYGTSCETDPHLFATMRTTRTNCRQAGRAPARTIRRSSHAPSWSTPTIFMACSPMTCRTLAPCRRATPMWS